MLKTFGLIKKYQTQTIVVFINTPKNFIKKSKNEQECTMEREVYERKETHPN